MFTKRMVFWGLAVAMVAVAPLASAQAKVKASQPAEVKQGIGQKDTITINYHRPGIRERDVWTGMSENAQIGRLVPHDEDPRPWRAGANNATTITFSGDVKVEGKDLEAGTYALFMVPTKGDWTVIFSKQAKQWGSFRYDKKDDALRVTVTPGEAPHQEWLMYGFDDTEAYSAVAYLRWGKKRIPFKIEATPAE